MSLREKLTQHLQMDWRQSMELPVDEKSPLYGQVISWNPLMALDMNKILTLSGGGTNSADFHIWTIIEKAEEQENQKAFTLEDKPLLERLGWRILADISNKIHGIEVESASFARTLSREIEIWMSLGLITPEAKGKILERYVPLDRKKN